MHPIPQIWIGCRSMASRPYLTPSTRCVAPLDSDFIRSDSLPRSVSSLRHASSGLTHCRGPCPSRWHLPWLPADSRPASSPPPSLPSRQGSDYLRWRDLIVSRQLAAMVRDLPPLQWLANNAPNCEVTVLAETVEPFDYGESSATAGRQGGILGAATGLQSGARASAAPTWRC